MYGNKDSEIGKKNSGFGSNKSEDAMTSVALKQAIGWNEELMTREFRGRGDRDYMIRHRLSKATGIPESYLYRLQHKTSGMKDVAGEYYRRLKLYYETVCESNEEAADRYRAERLGTVNHETTGEKHPAQSVGVATAESQKGESPHQKRT